ncbi:PaaI family thioesterase [Pelomonas sp. APW6]|uniref:PaaI family thioesterase n=1 Tax=Roseateles subflavus TaxID=3053353 RepID=A0ABT7LE41_9BURK|nr:PaaI family thioesterase [Pelomonas sp. APW6]MDL5031130.1 PaaI family thioesterase [Pelomonas sp. APW6]
MDGPLPWPAQDRAIRFPLDAAQRACWEARLNTMALLTHLGAALDLSDEQAVRIRLVRSLPAHTGGLGGEAINGATLAAMADCGIASAGVLLFRGRTCGTLQLSMDFMKPVRSASPELECRVLRRTHSLAFVEARLLGRNGALHFKASGIVSVARAMGGDDESWASRFAMPAPQGDGLSSPLLDSLHHHDATSSIV